MLLAALLEGVLMTDLIVTFDRIGAHRNIAPQVFKVRNSHDLTGEIMRFARKYLVSLEFHVSYDPAKRCGEIEGGRYGSFTVKEAPG